MFNSLLNMITNRYCNGIHWCRFRLITRWYACNCWSGGCQTRSISGNILWDERYSHLSDATIAQQGINNGITQISLDQELWDCLLISSHQYYLVLPMGEKTSVVGWFCVDWAYLFVLVGACPGKLPFLFVA